MPHVHGMLCSSLLSLFTLNTTRTSLFNFVAIQFGLSRPGMIKSANQNTNIEKGAVVILLICTYVIKNSLKNIAYKYPPIYLLFSILNLLLGKSKVR